GAEHDRARRRYPARSVVGSACALALVSHADRPERLPEIQDQHAEGMDGREDAAALAFGDVRARSAVPATALPPRKVREDLENDHGRGRAAGRLHRRGDDYA